VAAALRVIVKDPAEATTFLIIAVGSFERMTGKIRDSVETSELVTVIEVAPAAKFTVPAALLIVRAPVVPAVVFVASMPNDPEFPIVRLFVGESVPMPTLPVVACIKNLVAYPVISYMRKCPAPPPFPVPVAVIK